MKKPAKLKVKKGHNGVFQFEIYLNGIGSNVDEAWEDVLDSIGQIGLGPMPQRTQIKLVDQEPE
jgi:hypothetical protein